VVVAGLVVTGACTDDPRPVAKATPPSSAALNVDETPTTTPARVTPDVTPGDPSPVPAAASTPVPLVTPLPVASVVLPLVDDSRPTVSGGETLSSTRALTTWVWYPLDPGGGPWPLVVFAHGYEVGPAPYAALCEAWAAAGYIVAAPEFPLTDEDVAGDWLDEYDIENQPDDVRFVIGSLVAPDSPLPVRVDPDRLAVAGHSDGGVTALGVAVEPLDGLRAVIALSAAPVYGSVDNPPILVVQGDEDDISGYESGAEVYGEAVSPRYMLTLLGGGHLPPFLDGSEYLDTVDKVAVAFLDRYVAGRPPTADDPLDGTGVDPDVATLDADP
jgi:pimeloyl-ACP methyl ester carboxylesterase